MDYVCNTLSFWQSCGIVLPLALPVLLSALVVTLLETVILRYIVFLPTAKEVEGAYRNQAEEIEKSVQKNLERPHAAWEDFLGENILKRNIFQGHITASLYGRSVANVLFIGLTVSFMYGWQIWPGMNVSLLHPLSFMIYILGVFFYFLSRVTLLFVYIPGRKNSTLRLMGDFVKLTVLASVLMVIGILIVSYLKDLF